MCLLTLQSRAKALCLACSPPRSGLCLPSLAGSAQHLSLLSGGSLGAIGPFGTGVNMVIHQSHLYLAPVNMTLFANRIFADVIKMRLY